MSFDLVRGFFLSACIALSMLSINAVAEPEMEIPGTVQLQKRHYPKKQFRQRWQNPL